MLIEIHGDVWLVSEIIAICLDEPIKEEWQISLRIRGVEELQCYDMDSEGQAKAKHLEMIATWKAVLNT